MNRYIILCLAGLTLGMNSCELKEEVFSTISTESFYKTAGDAEAALTAAYSPLADLYSGPSALLAADLSSDHIYPRAVVGRNTYTLFNYDVNYTTVKSFSRTSESPYQIWKSSYEGIEKANWVIARIPETKMAETRKEEILGEAYFLRAYYHWMLTKNFGDIVVKTKASISVEDAIEGKSPSAEVYKQIYLDLDQAEQKLPTNSSTSAKGRPSKEVAIALYAKAALYNNDWGTALQKAQAVIDSKKYILLPEVTDLFDVNKEDYARQEIMWAFEGESFTPGRSSQIMSLYGPRNSDAPAYGKSTFGSLFAYQSFFNSFDPKDKRRTLLDTNYVNHKGQVVSQKDITPVTPKGVLVKKYNDPNSVGQNAASNVPILRLADIYLIAAEAEARLNGPTTLAYSYINEVKKRANIDELIPGLSATDFINAVLQERSWEFFAEGDRWYDLTRTNTFLVVIPNAVNEVYPARAPLPKHRYFPIPQDEINANNKLEQNPDWK